MPSQIPLSQPFLSELESKYVARSVDSGWLTQSGEYVGAMEGHIGSHIYGSDIGQYVTTTSNGTTALHLVLMSLGVGPGDEVIVPDFGYIAPVNSVLMCGATPVVVDVDIKSWCLDPDLVAGAVTERTKAVIAIDNYGIFADIQAIKRLIPEQIIVIQDAAESFPTILKSAQHLFTGDLITTSFYANKIVTAAEGGAITGPSVYLEKIKSLKNQSVKSKGTFEHIDVGYNYRISNLHAALFEAQWERLPQILENRIRVFDRYFEYLVDSEVNFESNQYPVYLNPWLMTIRLPKLAKSIENIRLELSENGIETRPGFKPASKHQYLEGLIKLASTTQNSHALHAQIISLPTYPELKNEQIEFVCDSLLDALDD